MHASEIASKHCSPRYHVLDRFERYVLGTQYDGRHPFLQESDNAPPLLERAPCIVYPLVANAIRSHADFVLGEGRWPAIRPRAGSLPEEQLEALAERVAEACGDADLESAAREALEAGLGAGTVASVIGRRDGCLFVENVRAAWCTPTLRRDVVVSLEIRYPYTDVFYNGSSGQYEERCLLYRRVIDGKRDVTYVPQPAPPDGRDPGGWVEDAANTVAHGLPFVPVVWWPVMQRERMAGRIDGHPIHEHLLDELDALNFSLSQRHRAALYTGDPLRWESGVDMSAPPGTLGRDAHVSVEVSQDGRGPHPKGTFRFAGGRTMAAPRKVGAGALWSSENENYKVGMLTLPGDALKAIDDHARDLKSKLQESMGVVDLDIENAKLAADMSGKAQQVARQRQVDRDNAYRQDFGARWLLPVVRMLLKVAGEPAADVDALRLDLAWGPYFASTAADQKAIVELIAKALEAKVITRKIAIEKLRSEGVFAIDSAAAVASEPTVEDALAVKGLGLGSESFDRIYTLRLAMSLLGEVDPQLAKDIEAEIEAAALHSTALRAVMVDNMTKDDDADDEGAAETLGQDREGDDAEPDSGRDGKPAVDEGGG